MTHHRILIVVAGLLIAGGIGCDSNPTPHPEAHDATHNHNPHPGRGNGEDGDDLNSEGGRDNQGEDAGPSDPAASVDATDGETSDAVSEVEETETSPSGEFNGEDDPCQGASGDDGDTDSAPPTTLPPEPDGPIKRKAP